MVTRGRAEAPAVPERIVRHRLPDRVFHWVQALAVLALLATGFLPILGVRFSWVTMHWIAGLVLLAAVLFHVVRALAFQEPRTMWVDGRDLRNARDGLGWILRRRPPPGKPGKYLLAQKLFHHVVALVLLATLVTGLMMMVRVDTPFWTRNPYWLSDRTWGVVYVLHGLAAMAVITLLMLHVYFALRPEKLWITRSMILGWISRGEYAAYHGPERWRPGGAERTETAAKRAPAMAVRQGEAGP